eukprot:SAG22_NODE_128_length_18787_cov_19.577108_18_plen_82_part_00
MFLWDMANKKRVLAASIAPILSEDSRATFCRAQVLSAGVVAVTLTNGYSYVFDTEMQAWCVEQLNSPLPLPSWCTRVERVS